MKELKSQIGRLLKTAKKMKVSDCYIIPYDQYYHIKLRQASKMVLWQMMSKKHGQALIAYLKYMGHMDLAEHRRVQTGAAQLVYQKERFRIRLSTIGDYRHRETLVIRLLDLAHHLPSTCLFFSQKQQLNEYVWLTPGMYIFSGPTGAGKTTLMYRFAKDFAKLGAQVISIEDPVEIMCDEMMQFQVNTAIGMDYETLIQGCLRHRPDLLIIGEIRDRNTAQVALQAALTGHCLFVTIHALSKEGIWQRLYQLGLSQEELQFCLRGLIYQELLPVLSKNKKIKQAALYDLWFLHDPTSTKTNTWNDWLRKAWCYGAIDEHILQRRWKY